MRWISMTNLAHTYIPVYIISDVSYNKTSHISIWLTSSLLQMCLDILLYHHYGHCDFWSLVVTTYQHILNFISHCYKLHLFKMRESLQLFFFICGLVSAKRTCEQVGTNVTFSSRDRKCYQYCTHIVFHLTLSAALLFCAHFAFIMFLTPWPENELVQNVLQNVIMKMKYVVLTVNKIIRELMPSHEQGPDGKNEKKMTINECNHRCSMSQDSLYFLEYCFLNGTAAMAIVFKTGLINRFYADRNRTTDKVCCVCTPPPKKKKIYPKTVMSHCVLCFGAFHTQKH